MKSLKSGLIILGSVGLLFLGACNNSASNTEPTSPAANTSKTETASTGKNDKEHSHGGQVVESGQYHLELVPGKEDDGTHIDFYLEKGEKHESVTNAKVTAQIQLPDGTLKTLPLTYDSEGKHYHALLSENATGQYQVKITSDMNGEKVDGRFSFNR